MHYWNCQIGTQIDFVNMPVNKHIPQMAHLIAEIEII